jgi:hypothetical protein
MAFQGKSNGTRRKNDADARKANGKRCTVYCMVDLLGGDQVYVGQTRTSLETRLLHHIQFAIKAEDRGIKLSPVQRFILERNTTGDLPLMTVLQRNAVWDIAEAVWIDRLTRDGAKLLNVASRVPSQ